MLTTLKAHDLVERVRLFHGERPELVEWLLDVAEVRDIAEGEFLLHACQPNSSLYFILEGGVRIELEVDGRPVITALGEGECVGELSVLDSKLTTAHVVAASPTKVLIIERRYIWQLIDNSHAIARNLLYILSSKVRNDDKNLGESLVLQRRYEQSMRIDALTGLYNRLWLDQMLPRLVERFQADSNHLGLMLLDVDHFKHFNDSYGHQAGDEVLRAVGAAILEHIRSNDSAVRYGGEEFVVILPDIDEDELQAAAERLCRAIREQPIEDGMGRPLPGVTVSIGAALLEGKQDRRALVSAADKALYRAKREGRDRVVVDAPD